MNEQEPNFSIDDQESGEGERLQRPLGELVSLKDGVTEDSIGRIERNTPYVTSFVDLLPTKGLRPDYEDLEPFEPMFIDKLKQVFDGQIVVDLGAGQTARGYQVACLSGAKAYVGVDLYKAGTTEYCIKLYQARVAGKSPVIPYATIETDMLSFLRAIEDDSVSFILSGLDSYVMGSSLLDGSEYEDAVRDELVRTIAPKGGILSNYQSLYPVPHEDVIFSAHPLREDPEQIRYDRETVVVRSPKSEREH